MVLTEGRSPPGQPGSRPARPPSASPGTPAGRDPGPDGRTPPRADHIRATAALAAVTMVSAAGLARVFTGSSWIAPVIATSAVIHGLSWWLRRRRVHQAVAAPVVVAAIALMVCWTVFGADTRYGIPGAGTWSHIGSAAGRIGSNFSTMIAPVAPTRGFLLLAVAGAGAAAALGDWSAFRWRRPLMGLVPGLAVFIFCCTAGQGRGRSAVVGAEVAALCAFILLERIDAAGGEVWFAGIRPRPREWIGLAGTGLALIAVIAAVAVTPALAPRDGGGVLGLRTGLGQGGGERIVPNPLVDLQTRLTRYANTPVFVVSSPVPSYWRLTSLDTFDGSTWTSTGSYSGFGGSLPGAAPAGAAVRSVRASFFIQQLDSVWLPAQFDPVSVQGVRHVTYDASSDSLLTAGSTANGLRYSVTAYQYLAAVSAARLAAAPPTAGDANQAQDTQLPRSVDGPIADLALTITAGRSGEYAKAMAIQDYLRSSRFAYNLDPPTDGTGDQAIYNFLFVTHQGYCQQFAGSFAVLARAAGIPTRLAVGFVTGDAEPGGTYQVYDKDAHTWPEVYFGPRYGWVPFEPTPGFSVPGTGRYAGSGDRPGGTVAPVPTTVPAPSVTVPAVVRPALPQGSTTATTLPSPGGRRPAEGVSLWWLALPAVGAAWLGLNLGIPALRRRVRRARAGSIGSAAVALYAWSEVSRRLAWYGLVRQRHETDAEFARRGEAVLARMEGDGPARRTAASAVIGGPGRVSGSRSGGGSEGGPLAQLASLAGRAGFAEQVPERMGDDALAAAGAIHERLDGITSRRQRLGQAWAPPPGTWIRLRARVGLRTPGGS